MKNTILPFALVALFAAPAVHAQIPAEGPLPAGHPPIDGPGKPAPSQSGPMSPGLPADHPPVGSAPPASAGMPGNHPPMGAGTPSPGPVDPSAPLPAGHPPMGPADVINQGRAAESANRPSPEMHRALGRGPSLSSAQASSELPAGTIRVNVVDPAGKPVADALIRVGVMQRGGARDAHQGKTDSAGRYTVSGLATGAEQAYRVSLDFEGARYGAMPFRLDAQKGMDVQMVRLPTTRSDARLLLLVGQTFFEFRENRLHVTQQMELANVGAETIVYPEGGAKKLGLPAGFVGFEAEKGMGDQRLVPGDKAVELKGSIPPGRVALQYSYDLPMSEGSIEVAIPVPYPTISYRVVTDAPPGMQLEVEGFERAMKQEFQGRPILTAELNRKPTDPPFKVMRATLRGLPGPGPLRWVAVALAVLLGGLGVAFLVRPARRVDLEAGIAQRQRELLAEATELARQFDKGEVGPQYRARRHDEIATELAALLRRQTLAARTTAKS